MTRSVEADDLLLALETSGPLGTVALGTGAGEVLARVSLEEPRQHAARLVPAVDRALRAADAGRRELDGIVVGAGPGSFTGVRVAAATAKGLCHALGLPLRAVSSLAAAALTPGGREEEEDDDQVRYVLFDARGDRVYGACYRVAPHGVETLAPPHAGTVGEVLAGSVPPDATFVGAGAQRHAEVIVAAGHRVGSEEEGVPSAGGLLRWMALHPGHAPVARPGLWEPTYLRASNAEREWSG